MLERMSEPWPWYVAGPLIGLMVPLLLILGNKSFGISANLRHICSAVVPAKPSFLRYPLGRTGGWNLAFALGIVAGGWLAAVWLDGGRDVIVSVQTQAALVDLGFRTPSGLAPPEIFSAEALWTLPSLLLLVGGGFLIGFGSGYGGGCTSGHAISGLADLQLPSLLAVLFFFVGGLLATHLVLPWIMS